MPQADLSVRVGVIAPALLVSGLRQREGAPLGAGLQRRLPCADRIQLVERGADPAAGKQPRHGSSCRGRDPVLAAVGRGSEHASGESVEPPRRPSASPMIAGHAAGQKLHRDYSDRPAGQRKLFSRALSRRPKGPILILSPARQDLAEAARLLGNVHACGPATRIDARVWCARRTGRR